MSTGMVQRRLQDGRLRRLHQGVYQVGPVQAALAREMAAVLACGPRAAVSHRSSAALRKLAGRPAGIVEVSVTQGHPRSSA